MRCRHFQISHLSNKYVLVVVVVVIVVVVVVVVAFTSWTD